MIPTTLLPDDLFKTLSRAREELEKRLKNGLNEISEAPVFHHGSPSPSDLPNERCAVWLDFARIYEEDWTHASESFMVEAEVTIICQDQGNDKYGYDPNLKDRIISQAIHSLFQTLEGNSLSDAVEETNFVSGDGFAGRFGGDHNVVGWVLTLQLRLGLGPSRCPPDF